MRLKDFLRKLNLKNINSILSMFDQYVFAYLSTMLKDVFVKTEGQFLNEVARFYSFVTQSMLGSGIVNPYAKLEVKQLLAKSYRGGFKEAARECLLGGGSILPILNHIATELRKSKLNTYIDVVICEVPELSNRARVQLTKELLKLVPQDQLTGMKIDEPEALCGELEKLIRIYFETTSSIEKFVRRF